MYACGEDSHSSRSVADHICKECGKTMQDFSNKLEEAGSQEKKMELMLMVSEINEQVETCVLEAYGKTGEDFKEEVLNILKNECEVVFDLVRAIK